MAFSRGGVWIVKTKDRGQKINANFFCTKIFKKPSVMDVRAEHRGHPHRKVRFPAARVMGRNFWPLGTWVFSKGKTPEFTKMGEIHELFFWPFLWFGLPGRLLKVYVYVDFFPEKRAAKIYTSPRELSAECLLAKVGWVGVCSICPRNLQNPPGRGQSGVRTEENWVNSLCFVVFLLEKKNSQNAPQIPV